MINQKRLVEEFLKLVRIDSESKDEARIAGVLKDQLSEVGGKVIFDDAGTRLGGNCGNLIAKIPGTIDKEMILLNAHMDTVKPGKGVKPQINGDIIKSDGSTVLGADDKSGIAVIMEALRTLKEQKTPHRPVEVVFTISEEQGVIGSRNLDYSLLDAKMGFALDDHAVDTFTIAAPAKSVLDIKVKGIESHAGIAPEKGISAIVVASKAIAQMKLGRISPQTTANIGRMIAEGSVNIVPNLVEIKAEARSLDNQELQTQIDHIKTTFEETAKGFSIQVNGKQYRAEAEIKVTPSYSAFTVKEHEPVYQLAGQATEAIGLTPKFNTGLGGSDANHFNQHGIKVIMLGTGMDKVHTKSECISIREMVNSAQLVIKILT